MDKETRLNQVKTVFKAFYYEPMTMKEAEKATGIMRSNICWYCRDFRSSNNLFQVTERICRITKHKAQVLTTNPDLMPPSDQLKMF